MHHRLQDILDAEPGLRAGHNGLLTRDGQDLLELLLHGRDIRVRQVDLVDDRHDGEPLLHGEVHIRHRLRLHPLRGIHDEQSPFAGRQGARNFVREIDVAGGIQQVQPVGAPILRLVLHGHGVGLDGDAPLAFEIHGIEQLRLGVPLRDGAGELQQPVGKRGLPVIDMGDDAEIPDVI